MNNLTQVIDQAIENALGRYFDRVAKEYDGIEREELQVLWAEVAGSAVSLSLKKTGTTVAKPKKSPSKSVAEATEVATATEDTGGCPYMFQRGEKSGESCGAASSGENNYCARHKKYEGKVQKERKVVPAPKRSIKPKSSKGSPGPKPVGLVLRKHQPTGLLWHPESTLSFKSARERVVVGKIVKNKFVPLEESDVPDCKKWGFAFEPVPEEKKEDPLDKEDVEVELSGVDDEEVVCATEARVDLVIERRSQTGYGYLHGIPLFPSGKQVGERKASLVEEAEDPFRT